MVGFSGNFSYAVFVCLCVCVFVYLCLCICVYVFVFGYLCLCICVCAFVFVYLCFCICVCVVVLVCLFVLCCALVAGVRNFGGSGVRTFQAGGGLGLCLSSEPALVLDGCALAAGKTVYGQVSTGNTRF